MVRQSIDDYMLTKVIAVAVGSTNFFSSVVSFATSNSVRYLVENLIMDTT